jgi:hypothetical protein
MSVLLFMEDGKSPLHSSIITSDTSSKFEIRKGALFSSSYNSPFPSTSSSRTTNNNNSITTPQIMRTRRYSSSDDNDDSILETRSDDPSDESSGSTRRSQAQQQQQAAPNEKPHRLLRRVYSAGEQRSLRKSEQKAFAEQAANSIVHHGFYV